jgi:uncharacterized membrane protein
MFHAVYIVLENGVCIFSKNFTTNQIDSQLFAGFLSALGSFATESLGSGMQSLKLQTGEQLSILKYSQGKTPLVGIVLADPRDNSKLISNLLLQILTEFHSIFQRQLESGNNLNVNEFKEFSFTIDSVLEGKVASRTRLKMVLGVIIGLVLMGFILVAFIPAFIRISNFQIEQLELPDIEFSNGLDPSEIQTLQTVVLVVMGALMLFTCIIFVLPTFLAAYIAGNRQRGIWTAILLGISVALIILIATPFVRQFLDVNIFWWYVTFSPLLIFIALVCGFYGGRLKEQRRLYPLPTKNEPLK